MGIAPKTKKAKKRRSNLNAAATAVMILIIAVSGIYIYNYYHLKNETERVNRELAQLYNQMAEAAATPEETAGQAAESEPEALILSYPQPPEEVRDSFKELIALNRDLVGRLYVPQRTVEPIELFVVQRDNLFYLNHDFYGKESKAGTLFLDQANQIWPADQHMIIYGHNMKNGTMFARLPRYKSIGYAKYNPFAYFETLYESGTYVVLAAMQLPANDLLSGGFNIRTFSFGDVSFDAFIHAIYEKALYVTEVGVNENDQLLSLVTCSYDQDDERFALILRQLREGETEEDILTLFGRK